MSTGFGRGVRPRGFVALVAAGLALATAFTSSPSPAAADPGTRPDIVVIVADDQRWDTLWAMPNVQSELVGKGITFENGYVPTPVCCPSRASILTGKYSHSTMVYGNHGPYGGVRAFDDSSTVATWLQASGYRTGMIGRYLNHYDASFVPPGWDHWFVRRAGSGGYYRWEVNDNGTLMEYGSEPADYATDVLAAEAASFVQESPKSQPLLMFFWPNAPHLPSIPADRHADAFAGLGLFRPPSYNERDMSDKPRWAQRERRMSVRERTHVDEVRLAQYRTLLALDDGVGTIIDALEAAGRLENTFILYTSDHGYLWGEHRSSGKIVPYEESLRVPYIVRYDALGAAPRTDPSLVLNIDIAPTAAELAGVEAQDVDGSSLLRLLENPNRRWRKEFLIERTRRGRMPAYCGVHGENYSYVYFDSGEEEFHRLARDPFELRNLAGRRSPKMRPFHRRLRKLCDPPPPGLRLP